MGYKTSQGLSTVDLAGKGDYREAVLPGRLLKKVKSATETQSRREKTDQN